MAAADAAVDDRVVADDVRSDAALRLLPLEHDLEGLQGGVEVLALRVGLDHRRVDDGVGPDRLPDVVVGARARSQCATLRLQNLVKDRLSASDLAAADKNVDEASERDVVVLRLVRRRREDRE